MNASETLNMFRSLEMFLRWKNAVFVTWEIWFSKDKLLSNITPKSIDCLIDIIGEMWPEYFYMKIVLLNMASCYLSC